MSNTRQDIQVRFHKIRDVESCDGIKTTFVNDSLGRPYHLHRAEWSASLSPAVLARFKCELKVLSELDCESLLTPSEVQFTKNGCWVVCPATDTTALTVLMTELSLRELLSMTDQFLEILKQVHDAGLFIRCVRPQEIFLSERTGELQMMLAGCPPLHLLNAVNETQSSMSLLTYSAPEALGALEYEYSASSDLYSLGILLHECLTGRPPFPSETARELLFHHVTTPAPNVCDTRPDLPRCLGQIVQRLLKKNPGDRYQTATGLQHDIRQVIAQLNDTSVVVVPGVGDHREQLIEPAHVGREKEAATLENELKPVRDGSHSSVLLTAPSGVGKSRLLEELKLVAERNNYQILIGQGQNQVGLPPLATLRPALSHCAEALRASDDLVDQLRPELQDFAAELHAAVPEITQLLNLAMGDRKDRQLSDRRMAVALATLLGHIATPQTPVLFVLDDAQWADDLTLTILDCWELIAPRHSALVVSSRPTDRMADRLRKNINFSAEINLTSLSRRDSDVLLASMAGELPDEVLTKVWEMASGNPFISSAVLRGFVESGVLSSNGGHWVADQEQLRNLQMSGEAAEVLKQRLVRLHEDTRRLLAVGAVLGKEFSVEVAATLADQSVEAATASLEQPVSLYLIWLKGDCCQFVHDQIRDSMLQSLGVTDQQMLQIDVCDSGVGIPPSAQADVFEPFKQADDSVNRKFGGTGLGLPISRKLARALGGDIVLTSEVGVGSTFRVTLATGALSSVEMLSPAEALQAKPHSSVDALTEVNLSGIRILIADDMDANRAFFTRTLEAVGAEIVTANDGREAVELWHSHDFDLILMDMRMPVMDGHEAVIELRRLGEELPIVALTANGRPEYEARCQEEGCSGYLSRPISMDALRREVAEILGITAQQPKVTPATAIDAVQSTPSSDAESSSGFVEQGIEIPDDPFFVELAVDLIAKITQSLPKAHTAIAGEATAPLIEQGHWMKGTGGTVGLPVLTKLGAALEDSGHNQDFASARTVLSELEQTIEYINAQFAAE